MDKDSPHVFASWLQAGKMFSELRVEVRATRCEFIKSTKFTNLLPPSGGCGYRKKKKKKKAGVISVNIGKIVSHWLIWLVMPAACPTFISSALSAPVLSIIYVMGLLTFLLGCQECLAINSCFKVPKSFPLQHPVLSNSSSASQALLSIPP